MRLGNNAMPRPRQPKETTDWTRGGVGSWTTADRGGMQVQEVGKLAPGLRGQLQREEFQLGGRDAQHNLCDAEAGEAGT